MIGPHLWLLLSLQGCPPPSPPPLRVEDDSPGAQAAIRLECARCHSAPGRLTPEPRERDCVGCHQAVFTDAFDTTYRAEGIARWRQNVRSLRYTPSLVGTARLQADWLERFLAQPHDLRPHLPAEMPRLPMTDLERADLIAWLGGAEPDPLPWSGGDPSRGLALLAERGCGGCHVFSGSGVLDTAPEAVPPEAAAIHLAPDLRHVRERMAPSALLAWLEAPADLKPDTLMPTPLLSPAEREDVAAALLRAPLAAPDPDVVPARLPLLDAPVRYAEVEEAVFHRVCWHCHSDPDGNHGDGGPGNTGGLGYAGVGLDLGSREGILRGIRLPNGQRQSVLDGDPPLLVEVMLRRHRELAGQSGARPGMPLGLTPLSPAQIQLVETWIAQGTPP